MLGKPNPEDIKFGQIIYTKKTLPIYDLMVTKFSNRFLWHCPRKVLVKFFKDNISQNHLDIGVGTGYFLQKCNLDPKLQRIGLLDLNKDCLDYASSNLQQFHLEIYHQDIFEPFIQITKKFDSVSLNYVLHCLPGSLTQKAVIFDHIKTILNPAGKFFGSTILGKGVRRNWLAEKLITTYNQKKIFHNLDDDSQTLLNELKKRFSHVQLCVKGCVALFVASDGN